MGKTESTASHKSERDRSAWGLENTCETWCLSDTLASPDKVKSVGDSCSMSGNDTRSISQIMAFEEEDFLESTGVCPLRCLMAKATRATT